MTAARSSTADHPTQAASHVQPPDAIEDLRAAASLEDENGQPLLAPEGTDPSRPIGKGNPKLADDGGGHGQANSLGR